MHWKFSTVAARASLAFAVSAALMLGGCSPYIHNIRHTYEPDPNSPKIAGGLGVAMDEVGARQAAMYEMASNQAKIQNGLVLTLIPLSAAALYHSIRYTGDGTRGLVMKAGLIGAAGYGIVSLLRNPAREELYLVGSQVLGCAVLSMRPYLVEQGTFTTFKSNLADLRMKIPALDRAIRRAKAQLPGIGPEERPHYAAEITAAEGTLRAAEKVLSEGIALEGQIGTSGMLLRERARTLIDEINVQIGKTQPDLAAIARVTGGLMQMSSALVPVQAATSAPSSLPAKEAANQARFHSTNAPPFTALETAAKDAADATLSVAGMVNRSASIAKDSPAIDQCKAPTAQSVLVLSLEKLELDFHLGVTREFSVLKVTGGPRHALTGSYTGKRPFDVQVAFTNGIYHFTVTAPKDATPPAEMELVITDDTALARKSIKLKLEVDAAAEEDKKADEKKKAEEKKKADDKKKADEKKKVEAKKKEEEKTKAGQNATDPKKPTPGSDGAVPQPGGASGASTFFAGGFSIGPDEIRELQAIVSAKTRNGILDADTMRTVGEYAVKKGFATAPPKQLDRELYKKIRSG